MLWERFPIHGGIRESFKGQVFLFSAKPAFPEPWNTHGSVTRDESIWYPDMAGNNFEFHSGKVIPLPTSPVSMVGAKNGSSLTHAYLPFCQREASGLECVHQLRACDAFMLFLQLPAIYGI